jgi:hypothetical protein
MIHQIRSWMPKGLWVPSVALAMFLTVGCTVEKEQEGEMPEVDVQVEGGQLPEYDVDAADVEVTTEERTITVPEVNIEPPADDDEPPVQ